MFAVDRRQVCQVGKKHQHDRDLVEVFGEPSRTPCRHAGNLGSLGQRSQLQYTIGDRRPRGEARGRLGQVVVPPREVGVPQRTPHRGFLHHHDPPCLTISAVRGKTGGVQQSIDGVVGDLFVEKVPYGTGGPEGFDQLHLPDRSGPGAVSWASGSPVSPPGYLPRA